MFELLNEKNLNIIKLKGNLLCIDDNITFTNSDLKKSINDIEEKGMPLLKGVLFGSIKRQKEIKKQ